jgi:hypothetical protein
MLRSSVILLFCGLILSSCCNWHLKRIQAKCGVRFKSDTTYIKVRDSIPEIKGTGTLSIAKQDSALLLKIDSLLNINHEHPDCDSIVKALKAKIRTLVLNRPIVPDTHSLYTHGGYIKAWMGKKGFQFEVNIPKQIIEKNVPCVTVVNEYSPKQGWKSWLGWILFAVVLVLAFLFRR